MIISNNTTPKVMSCYKPKKKMNLVKWMTKHNVSSGVISTPHAISRAIDSEILTEDFKLIHDDGYRN